MSSQITGVSIVCSTVCLGAGQSKHQGSASLAFVRGIHRSPVDSPHKGPVTRKMLPFDDVIMSRHYIKLRCGWSWITNQLSKYVTKYDFNYDNSYHGNFQGILFQNAKYGSLKSTIDVYFSKCTTNIIQITASFDTQAVSWFQCFKHWFKPFSCL